MSGLKPDDLREVRQRERSKEGFYMEDGKEQHVSVFPTEAEDEVGRKENVQVEEKLNEKADEKRTSSPSGFVSASSAASSSSSAPSSSSAGVPHGSGMSPLLDGSQPSSPPPLLTLPLPALLRPPPPPPPPPPLVSVVDQEEKGGDDTHKDVGQDSASTSVS